ncbi:cyclohexanecarboxylate-CoA ligase (plasmid) [Paraburkholderia sp. PGU19]|uniref:class I adenylate-forming enzyme family protein n=1 Tax=Paraburkholderia sp. PGU19 TaxID=2735434 RepID=UPI0015D986E6|nr:class I adenylate-forming enzyme family protein [Paraburkholderia sp. PGU19]BCG04193.1 cyclohexanecarboxylate-CoA ligase [Paraburkholderia sp. PGU19]
MQNILTLHNPETAREYYLSGVWQQDTLYTLARRHARETPTSCALRDAELRLTWRETVDWADSVAESLHRAGLRAGDRVGVWLPNVVETVIVFLACSRNGYVCCPSLHQNYTVDEIALLLEQIDCRALFAAPGYGADGDRHSIFARTQSIAHLSAVYSLDRHIGGRCELEGIAAFPERVPPALTRAPDLNPDKIVYLAFTSGTTGSPKGVMHSDNTLLANGRALTYDWARTTDTVLLSLSPMSHHIATVAIEQMLAVGFELAMTDPLVGRKGLDWIVETGATYVMGVPTHAMDVLAEIGKRGLREIGKVKSFYMAGAPIPRDVAQRFVNLGVTPQNVYGMTENGSHQYTVPDDTADTIVSTCGRSCNGYEVKLWRQDDPDTEARPGEVGEIGGRGGLLMLGYFSNQVATERSFNRHGWFMSGDLGVFTEDGCLKIVGRKKDLIIRGGHNIHPARIEELAMRHQDLERAAAFSVADERLGEKVCLAVICKPGRSVHPDALLAWLAEAGLSKYDMPEYFIDIAAFPMTASGKILKRTLVEKVAAGEIQPIAVRYVAEHVAGART